MDQGQGNGDPRGAPFVVVPFLPPTGNHIYVTNWHQKKRFLSKEAAAFKTRMITHVVQEKAAELAYFSNIMKSDPTAIFAAQYEFYFDEKELINATWGALDKQGNPKKDAAATRYKKMDAENRVKLVADALATALDIDDSLFFWGSHSKSSARLVGGVPQIHIFFTQVDPKRFGL